MLYINPNFNYFRTLFQLIGIESKLDYLVNLGVGGIWLSPIYKSPMADFGYDISNFTEIDPIFGTMDDFLSLINAAHSKGHLILG